MKKKSKVSVEKEIHEITEGSVYHKMLKKNHKTEKEKENKEIAINKRIEK